MKTNLSNVVQELNKRKIFHTTVVKAGEVVAVQVLKQANISDEGKAMLQEYYGFKDFSVPSSMKDPFVNNSGKVLEKLKAENSKAVSDPADIVKV